MTVSAFREGLQAREGAASVGESAITENRLVTMIEKARARWPDVELESQQFAKFVGERVPLGAQLDDCCIDELNTESLYLTCACAAGDAKALAHFETEFSVTITQALRGLDKTGALVDDATQVLRERLFVSSRERSAKIADYHGQGDLRRWVRAVATRIGLDLLRISKRERDRKEDDAVLAALPDGSSDPALAHFHTHYGAELKSCFAEALSALDRKQVTLLRYHYIDELTIDDIGGLFDVHRSTAFRWIERAREQLVAATRDRLKSRIGVDANDLNSVMKLVRSDLNLSLSRLLKSEKK